MDDDIEIVFERSKKVIDFADFEITTDAFLSYLLVFDNEIYGGVAADFAHDFLERFPVEHQHSVAPAKLPNELFGFDDIHQVATVVFDRGDFTGFQLCNDCGRARDLTRGIVQPYIPLFHRDLEARGFDANKERRPGDYYTAIRCFNDERAIDPDQIANEPRPTGRIAVSVALIQGSRWLGRLFEPTYGWLRDYDPIDTIGHTIHIYDIPPEPREQP